MTIAEACRGKYNYEVILECQFPKIYKTQYWILKLNNRTRQNKHYCLVTDSGDYCALWSKNCCFSIMQTCVYCKMCRSV